MLKSLWGVLSHRFAAWQHNSLLESNQELLFLPWSTSEAFGEAHLPLPVAPIILSSFRNPRQSQKRLHELGCTAGMSILAAAHGSQLEFQAREAHRSEEKGLDFRPALGTARLGGDAMPEV